MKEEELIAYSANFVAFLIEEEIIKDIDTIILFGSVARGNFDEESDIDIFIDTKKDIEKEVLKTLALFKKSRIYKKWELKGIKNEISIKVGEMKKWALKRDVLSDSIILYGKYKEMPDNVEYYLLIRPSFKKFNKSKQVKIWRKLYGYRQKVGKKTYNSPGLIENTGGRRLENGLIVPMKDKKVVIEFLNKMKVEYTVNEIWSDTLR